MPTASRTTPVAVIDASAQRAASDLATAKLIFFAAALLSLFMSVYLFFSGQRIEGVFVGVWVPSILSAGSLLLAGARHE